MKYESVTKRARNERLYVYYLRYPEESLKEIGVVFMISKQRVSKIIKREKELAGVNKALRGLQKHQTELGSRFEPASKE